jgi:hypothetical protein
MAAVETIRIEGLADLQAALRQMDAGSARALQVVSDMSAGRVMDRARPRVPSRTGAARASLKVRSGAAEAMVVGGSRKAPYYGWLDFGGRLRRGQSRPFVAGGRFIWPAYVSQRDQILEDMADALAALATDAGLKVH